MTDAQNRFLKLLTTQLKNQDPLNPMDNAQMTSQLAQISTVDGIEKAQCHIAEAGGQQCRWRGHAGGKSCRSSGDGCRQRPATWRQRRGGRLGRMPPPRTGAGHDQGSQRFGHENLSLGNLDAGTHNFTWDGTTDAGAQAVNGGYSNRGGCQRGTEKGTASALQLAGVTNINRSTQGVTLNLGNLGLVALSDLKQIF
jgi:flagellar basal-body rod modification protein FlgD